MGKIHKSISELGKLKSVEFEPNNLTVIDKLRTIKRGIDQKDESEYRRIDRKIEKMTKNKEKIDLDKICSKLRVKPMVLMDLMVDGVKLNAFSIVPRQVQGQIRFLEEKNHFFRQLLKRRTSK